MLGLAIGISIGTWVHMAIYGWLVSRIDWDEQARLAVARSAKGAAELGSPQDAAGGPGKEKEGLLDEVGTE